MLNEEELNEEQANDIINQDEYILSLAENYEGLLMIDEEDQDIIFYSDEDFIKDGGIIDE